MRETDEIPGDLPELPGLELETSTAGGRSPLKRAVLAQIKAMQDAGIDLNERVGLVALAIELADAVTAGRRAGRASAVAMAAGQLRETLLAIAPQDNQDGAIALMNQWLAAETDA